jgi:hypothetical protein
VAKENKDIISLRGLNYFLNACENSRNFSIKNNLMYSEASQVWRIFIKVEKTRFQKLTSNLGMLGTGAFVLSKSGKALALLKFTKLGPLFSMGFTTIAYSWVFGYP